MRKFELVSKDLQNYKNGFTEDLMYQIKGDINLIKQLVCKRVQEDTGNFLFEVNQIKQLNVYVVKDDVNPKKTIVFFDFDEYNDLCPIYQNGDFEIDNIEAIKNVVVNWLLGTKEEL